ncbi:MAG: 3-oxoacyl-[acyl-carrier-protein] reductase [Chloroflexi bacterium]|nr:3-oxoacyl-[acyl-carrier-protein] reductase [Chloroflexota bacterium]
MIDLNGRVAIVTGGGRGIGRAIALQLATLGAKVVVNYMSNITAAQEVADEIQRLGSQAVLVQGDVRLGETAGLLVKTAGDSFGRLDILVNNAGTTRDMLLSMMSEDNWDLVLDTNLKSAYHCSKAALRPMMRQRYGRIINITSVAGIAGNPGQANYSAAKAGMIGLTRSLAKEVGSRQITVNAVAPGFIPTDLTSSLPADLLERAKSMTPLGRLGTVEDVAKVVAFLASDAAAFITGEVIRVDGGMVI